MTTPNAEAINTPAAVEFAQAMAGQAVTGVASVETLRTQLAARGVQGQALALAGTAIDQMTQLADTFTALGGVLESHLIVGDAYAATGNEAGNKSFATGGQTGGPAMTDSSSGAKPPHRGGFDPDQPRDTAGRWTAASDGQLPDVLNVADGQECLASDQVRGDGPAPTELQLRNEPANDYWTGGTYVQVATPQQGPPELGGYAPPLLSPAEADKAADHLDDLAELADSGYQPPKPNRISRAAQLVEHLLEEDKASLGDKITVGDEEEFPLSVRELRKLLRDADPTHGQSQRRKVVAKAAERAGGDRGALWMDLAVGDDGQPRITVVGTEGEVPDRHYDSFTARYTPAETRQLAASLRGFATAARQHADGTRPAAAATAAPPAPAAATDYEITSGVWWSREQGTEAPYLDWSTTRTGGGRLVELSDGTTALNIDLDAGQVADLAAELGDVLNDPARDAGGLSVDDTTSLDITRTDNGAITLAFTDDDMTVSVPVPSDQLRSIHAQLLTDSERDGARA